MTVRWVSSSFILALTLVSPAVARPADRASHQQAAAELLEVMHVERSVADAIDMVLTAQLQANPQLAQFEDLLRAFLSKYMAWDALREDYIQLYVDTFSEAEIRHLLKFYRTPAGQKLIDALPQLMKKCAELGQAKVVEHLDELKAQATERALELEKAKETP